MTAIIAFVRQLGVELHAAADELDASDAAARPGDTVRVIVIALAITAASKKTFLA